MATALKLRTDIAKLKKGLAVKGLNKSLKDKLEAQLKKAEDELDKVRQSGKPSKKYSGKATQSALTKLQQFIDKPKYSVYKGKGVDLKKDAGEGAFKIGKRTSKGLKANQYGSKADNKGNTYYEYRVNRYDVKQPTKRQTYPKLADGGMMAEGGNIYGIEKYLSRNLIQHISSLDENSLRKMKKELLYEIDRSEKYEKDFKGSNREFALKKELDLINYRLSGSMADGGMMADGGELSKEDFLKKSIVYDNGGESLDRYTVYTPDGSVYGMSQTGSGFNQYLGEADEIPQGKHLGKKLKSVPKEIESAILNRMEYAYGGMMADGGEMAKGGDVKKIIDSRGNTLYLTYDDPTHFFLSVDADRKGNPYHIGQIKNEPYYNEVKEWLNSQKMADGGEMAKGGMVVTKIKDIPDLKEQIKLGRVTYRGLGLGELSRKFYEQTGTTGWRIKVKGKEYYISDDEFYKISRDKEGNLLIRFNAPFRKFEDGGSIPEGYHQMPDGTIMPDSAHMASGGVVSAFEQKIKDAFKEKNKWQFINDNFDGKNVQLKMFVGAKEVDVQRYMIDGLHASMPKNYVGQRETMKMILDAFNRKEGGGEMEMGGSYADGGEMAKGGKLSLREFEKIYNDNEDKNLHSENVVLLAENFGTESDIRDAKTILAKHNAIGYLPFNLSEERYALSEKLWKKYTDMKLKKMENGGEMAKGGIIGEYRIVPSKKGTASLSHIVEADYKMAFTINGTKEDAEKAAQSFVIDNNTTHPIASITKIHPSGQPLKNKKVSIVTKDEMQKFENGGEMAMGGSLVKSKEHKNSK